MRPEVSYKCPLIQLAEEQELEHKETIIRSAIQTKLACVFMDDVKEQTVRELQDNCGDVDEIGVRVGMWITYKSNTSSRVQAKRCPHTEPYFIGRFSHFDDVAETLKGNISDKAIVPLPGFSIVSVGPMCIHFI